MLLNKRDPQKVFPILKSGKLFVLTGPNGSGKSTWAKKTAAEKRDVFLGFQQPVTVPGVSYNAFLRLAYNKRHAGALAIASSKKDSIGRSGSLQNDESMGPLEFFKLLKEKAKLLEIPEKFLNKNLNENLSGGEKKMMEFFQALVLGPKFAIFDEIEAGLDEHNQKILVKGINSLLKQGTGILMITHNLKFLKSLKILKVYTMKNGQIN